MKASKGPKCRINAHRQQKLASPMCGVNAFLLLCGNFREYEERQDYRLSGAPYEKQVRRKVSLDHAVISYLQNVDAGQLELESPLHRGHVCGNGS